MHPTPSSPPLPHTVQPLAEGADNLWQGHWPDRSIAQVRRPELLSFRCPGPARGQVLVMAGGGYLQLVIDKEGLEIAHWLNGLGLDAHVLVHRLPGQAVGPGPDSPSGENGPGEVWPFDIALRDGLAALQHLARVSPGLPLLHLGLSSGGHLAGVLACQPHPAPLRLAGAVIAYAPINANHRAYKAPAGKPDYPPPEKQAFYDAWPIGIRAEPQGLPPCPVFLAYALHDAVVPLDHALNLIQALRAGGGAVDAHVFAQAPHGFALRHTAGTHDQWPALAARWMAWQLQGA
ncbi:alpha/beta hydrolase [Aquabacterium sp. OR-4]|uniref:alpha/beta hydrolase n=1 Tax=Aquabacterium sp. OR-4 TaxID=2978127 RepID=UPI0028C9016D|nr:prolyl oligopeptidase family serine peptidase [Aquabacterium sp. OR-4]MDT7838884.1 prolyl oligopeptidase family serine peptidase [Aquabacterium sp. OR-4]